MADQIEAGMVFVNAVGAESAELPFLRLVSSYADSAASWAALAPTSLNKKLIRVG